MRRSHTEFYAHFVWATWHREQLITDEIERDLYRCFENEARRLRCVVLAIGGMPDHVHLLVQHPANVAPSKIMQQVKGVCSCFGRDQLRPGELFGFQDNYGGFSVSRWDLPQIIAYIQNQKRHHAENTIVPEWEKTYEEVE